MRSSTPGGEWIEGLRNGGTVTMFDARMMMVGLLVIVMVMRVTGMMMK